MASEEMADVSAKQKYTDQHNLACRNEVQAQGRKGDLSKLGDARRGTKKPL